MLDSTIKTNVRVTVYVGETPGGSLGIQISNDIDVPCRLTIRAGEIILQRLNEMREAIVSDFMREGR